MRKLLRGWVIRLLVGLLDRTAAATGSLGRSEEVAKVAFTWTTPDVSEHPFAALRIWVEDRHALDVVLSPAQLQTLSIATMMADGALASSYGYPERPDFDVRYVRTVV